MYLGEHLEEAFAVARDPASSVRLGGFFIRSLLDSWEWSAGYTQHFGLVRVDRDTQDRTPKRSYRWLQLVLGGRG